MSLIAGGSSSSLLGATSIQVVARVIALVVSWVVLLSFQRTVSKDEFGLYNYYAIALTIGFTLVTWGGNTVAVREIASGRLEASRVIARLVRFHAASSAIVSIGIVAWAWIREDSISLEIWLGLALLLWVGHTLASPVAYFHARMNFATPAWASLVGSVAFLGISAFFLSRKTATYEWILIASVGGHTVQSLLVTRAYLKSHSLRDPMPWSESLRFGREMLPIGLSGIVGALSMYVDTLMVRELNPGGDGIEAVADYSAAFRILTVSLLIPVLFSQALFPGLSRLASASSTRFIDLVRGSQCSMLVLGLSLAGMLQFVSPDIVSILWDSKVSAASLHLQTLSWAIVLIYGAYPLIGALNALGRQREFLAITLVGGVFNVLSNSWLIPRYGSYAAGWTTVATEAFVLLAVLWRVRSGFSLRWSLKDFARIGLALMFGLAFGGALRGQGLWILGGGGLILAAGSLWISQIHRLEVGVGDEASGGEGPE